ncbi:hypothetical protein, partial [Clostridium oryzae]|uniref:hypothetical protein n=1 Tax=Clostridium oryzae TaxID=1450648 RepID=UPI001116CBD6
MIYNNLCHTIRTSKNQYYKYYLNSLNALVEENFKDSSLFSKTNILYTDILDYSIEIDSNDILNIIHINSNGELYYSLFSPEKSSKKLAQIDLNNFTIKFLT